MRCGDFRTSYRADMAIFDSPVSARRAGSCSSRRSRPLPLFATDLLARRARTGSCIAVIAATGLNILTGFTGQISLGNAAFLAVGAYIDRVPRGQARPARSRWSSRVAGLVTALVGMVFGVPSLRLKGLYLAMATLAAHFVVEFTVVHWESVTGGVERDRRCRRRSSGRSSSTATGSSSGSSCPSPPSLLLFARNLFRTKRRQGVRRHPRPGHLRRGHGGERLQVQAPRLRRVVASTSGVAGSLLAYQARIISPENFPITRRDRPARDDHHRRARDRCSARSSARCSSRCCPELLRLATGALVDVWPAARRALRAAAGPGIFGLAIVLFLVFEPDGMAARWHTIRDYWKLYPFSY